MDLGLKNKVIIVTGGSKGIGAGIVRAVAEEGGIPVIVGRSGKEGHNLVSEIKENGGQALFIEHVLGKADTCASVIQQVVDTFGHIYGLVNNAGANDGVSLEKGTHEQFRNSLLANLTHYFDMAHYCCPYLKESCGAIVNISSKTAITGQGGTSGYAASNGAQLSLTREWAVELSPYNVRVNAILPAEVMTPQYENWVNTFPEPDKILDQIKSKIPLGQRMTTTEEIAAMTLLLLSEKSMHTTGQWVFVDGGYVHLDRALAGNSKTK